MIPAMNASNGTPSGQRREPSSARNSASFNSSSHSWPGSRRARSWANRFSRTMSEGGNVARARATVSVEVSAAAAALSERIGSSIAYYRDMRAGDAH